MNTPIRTTEQSVSIYNTAKVYEGYTLIAPRGTPFVWLIDMKGSIVHYWKMKYMPGGDGRILPNGNLLRLSRTLDEPLGFFGSVGKELIEIDWDCNVVWKYEEPYMHHDFYRMENGNTMITKHVLIPKEIATHVKGGIDDTELDVGIWGSAFQEITPEGKVVWEWLGYEHMDIETDVICPLCPRNIWGYVNGLYVIPNGDVLCSFRELNTVAIIDKRTGDIKWRWGAPHELGHQHNPTYLENGNILIFDNGFHRVTNAEVATEIYSRVIEVNPKNGEVEWEYKDEDLSNFYSGVAGCAERLPNGNTLICESTKGRIFEVTSEKEKVWQFDSPFYFKWPRQGFNNLIFKAHRYGHEYEGLKGKKLDSNKFEWVLTEKDKAIDEGSETSDIESKINSRLERLGY